MNKERVPKVAYAWDRKTFLYIGTVLADPDPLDLENWIKPFCSSFDEPPQLEKNQAVVRDVESNEWIVKSDFRGAEYWDEDGTKRAITEVGEEVPEGALLEEPPEPELTFDELMSAALARRAAAYKAESDPLYIEWQYDQSEKGEALWRAKVLEVRERYPLPTDPDDTE